MTFPPWLALALLVSLALALIYELLTQRYGKRLLLQWAAIFVAFVVAELVAEALGWNVTRLGELRLAPDLGAALLAVLAFFLLHF